MPFLEAFIARLDGAMSRLIWWVATLPTAESVELGDLYGPFQLK